jgi:hypothetical protein
MVHGVSEAARSGGAPQIARRIQSVESQKPDRPATLQSVRNGNTVLDGSGIKPKGPSDVPDVQSVKPPLVVVKAPENTTRQRGSLLNISA